MAARPAVLDQVHTQRPDVPRHREGRGTLPSYVGLGGAARRAADVARALLGRRNGRTAAHAGPAPWTHWHRLGAGPAMRASPARLASLVAPYLPLSPSDTLPSPPCSVQDPQCGPLLILSLALKRWGPPRRQGLCSQLAPLWATSDFVPCPDRLADVTRWASPPTRMGRMPGTAPQCCSPGLWELNASSGTEPRGTNGFWGREGPGGGGGGLHRCARGGPFTFPLGRAGHLLRRGTAPAPAPAPAPKPLFCACGAPLPPGRVQTVPLRRGSSRAALGPFWLRAVC